jgi:hypothetical protein
MFLEMTSINDWFSQHHTACHSNSTEAPESTKHVTFPTKILYVFLPHTSYISNRYSTSPFSNMYALPFWNQAALCSHEIIWISFIPYTYLLPHNFNK